MYDTAAREDERPPSPIDRALLELDSGIERLTHHVGRLTDRLAPVIGPGLPEEAKPSDGLTALRSTAPLTDRLATIYRQISVEADRIGILMDRLEL